MMCKNHGYRHVPPGLVRAAALLCKDDEVMLETILAAALYSGLDNIRRDMADIVDPQIMAGCAALLEAERSRISDAAREEQAKCLLAWGAEIVAILEDTPF